MLFVISMLLLNLSGCSKQRAKLAINKTKKILIEAEKQEAKKYVPDLLGRANDSLKEAEDRLNRQEYKPALDAAKNAVAFSQQALLKAKQLRSQVKLDEAKKAIEIANQNDGKLENPTSYKQINDNYSKAEKKYKSEKWLDSITLSESIISDVNMLLQRLKNVAATQLLSVEQKINEVKNQEAEKYAPSFFLELQDLRKQIDNFIKVKYDYKNAIATADRAMKKAQETITKIKEKKSQENISKLENDLAVAIVKGAEIYAKQLFDDCSISFDLLVQSYYNKEYDKVLQAAELLRPKVQQLILITKTESAKAKIKTVQASINQLVEGGAREYLKGRVEKIEEMLKEAQAQFNLSEFEKVEEISARALEEQDRILAAFKDLASNAINEAQNTLNITRNVFDKVDTIFEKKKSEYMTPIEKDFENNKEVYKSELGQILKNSDVALVFAHTNLEEREYKKAIEKAGEVKKNAEFVLEGTYHVVAHNAILELATNINFYEKEGGEEFAPVELDRTKKLLSMTRDLVSQNKFREAVSKAAETRAQLETTIQVITTKAVKSIEQAKKDIVQSKEFKTDIFKQKDFEQSGFLLDKATQLLKTESLKESVRAADSASELAKMASVESAKIWAQRSIDTASKKVKDAEDAGATIYAADLSKKSMDLLKTAQDMFITEKFIPAKDTAIQAEKIADEARMKMVNDARQAIMIAKQYNGWKYKYDLLSQAIINGNEAERLLNAKDYVGSKTLAEKSIQQAQQAANESKQISFNEKVKRINSYLNDALNSGANFFEVKEAKSLINDIETIKRTYIINQHDAIMSNLDTMETKINRIIIDTPKVLEKVIAEQAKQLQKLDEEGIRKYAYIEFDSAKKYLNYAQIDFKAKKYQSSYENLRNAIKTIDDISLKYQDNMYSEKVRNLLAQLTEAMGNFRSVLELSPATLEGFAIGTNNKGQVTSIHGKYTPLEFREATDRLYALALELKPPTDRVLFNKDVVYVFRSANLAAKNFEKLSIIDELDKSTIISVINNAYDLINKAKKKQQYVQAELVPPEERSKLIKVETFN